ncbi:MAG: M28 family metallopeptidase [Promethearchaeota archaeon]
MKNFSQNPSVKNDSFDETKLFNYVSSFSFPRLAGTEGERKAVDLTYKTFKKIGYIKDQIQKQPFEFSDFYSTTLIQLISMMSLTFILFLSFFGYIYFLIKFLFIGIMAVLVHIIYKSLKYPEDPGFWGEYFGNKLEATNVFVKLPAKMKNERNTGNIIISAHLDSKSQTFRTIWRIIFYEIWLFSGIIFGIVYIIQIIYVEWIRFSMILPIKIKILNLEFLIIDPFIWITVGFISISNIALMFLYTGNKSRGANDNASGMAIVFALSEYFKNQPLDNYNLWFCQFSAEELGTMGSRFFTKKYEDILKKRKAFQINFDMVSAPGKNNNCVQYIKSYGILPRKRLSTILGKYFEKAALKENLSIKKFHLNTGAHTDTVPFHLRGYEAIDIITFNAIKFAHNKIDTPDKVDIKILAEACKIAKKTILMLDDDYKILSNI